jgi:hypothetical protein
MTWLKSHKSLKIDAYESPWGRARVEEVIYGLVWSQLFEARRAQCSIRLGYLNIEIYYESAL